MRRRAFLSTIAAAGTVSTAGCMGGDVVLSRDKSITVQPQRGTIIQLPGEGEKIKYIARANQPFDVYVFKSTGAYQQYKTYIDGGSPSNQPAGDQSLGGRAVSTKPDVYEVSTKDRGRQALNTDSTAYFALDHSGYRGETTVKEFADSLSVMLDLNVIKSKLPI